MIKRIILSGLLFLSIIASAQYAPVGHLTIFSEDGDKFQLVLNGELQNDIPQTNLRIEDLNQPYYNAKILFQDKSLIEISKNNLMITDADRTFQDVTYKIKRDKNKIGKMKMNFFSMIPVQQGYIAPANVYVMHYGHPEMNVGYSQTTTTTTTQDGMSVGANVNMGGINMNVNINEPYGTTVTETTTTHTSNNTNYNHEEPRHRGCERKYAMSSANFNNALATVKKQGFDETRLKTAKQIASANCLDVNQIMQLATIFGFEESKLDFAKFAFDYCVEPKNYFNLNNIFAFSSSVDELTDYIQNKN
jgi:hypothetical protein